MRLSSVAYCLAIVLVVATGTTLADTMRVPHRVGLIRRDNVTLFANSSVKSHVVAKLVEQTQVEVLRHTTAWSLVRVWASVRGWVRSREIVFRKPWASVSTYRAPEIHQEIHALTPQTIRVTAVATANVGLTGRPGRPDQTWIPRGSRVSVQAWAQDSTGEIWYRIGRQWAAAGNLRFLATNPARMFVGGRPLWKAVSGKGMWLTLGMVTDDAPSAILQAARANGVTHLYVESAISPLGFHGRDSVGPLLDAARAQGLTVIAWVYPYLVDVGSDVALTRQVAAYHTASGAKFGGIAVDLERNMTESNIRTYSQLVRAYLGTHYLLVGVTYPPQSIPTYPFREVASSYNVIAPMDYWHQTSTSHGLDYGGLRYGYNYGYRYAADSIHAIRKIGVRTPIAPIGQTFDNFGRLEMGPHAPSPSEIQGFLAGSRGSGAIGVSFFQWMTTTDLEWRTIQRFRF